MTTIDPVAFAAERAASRPAFLAFALAEYAAVEGLDAAALAARLGCTADVLNSVRLCLTPPADPDGFREAVGRICDQFGVHREPLVAAVECGRMATAVRAAVAEAPAEAGFVLAARDRP
jgi:hypothetical protein